MRRRRTRAVAAVAVAGRRSRLPPLNTRTRAAQLWATPSAPAAPWRPRPVQMGGHKGAAVHRPRAVPRSRGDGAAGAVAERQGPGLVRAGAEGRELRDAAGGEARAKQLEENMMRKRLGLAPLEEKEAEVRLDAHDRKRLLQRGGAGVDADADDSQLAYEERFGTGAGTADRMGGLGSFSAARHGGGAGAIHNPRMAPTDQLEGTAAPMAPRPAAAAARRRRRRVALRQRRGGGGVVRRRGGRRRRRRRWRRRAVTQEGEAQVAQVTQEGAQALEEGPQAQEGEAQEEEGGAEEPRAVAEPRPQRRQRPRRRRRRRSLAVAVALAAEAGAARLVVRRGVS